MKIRRKIYLLMFAISIIFSAGCSNLDSLARSVGKTFGKEHPETGVDSATVDEANTAYRAGNITLAEERYKEYVEKNQRSGDKASLAVANSQLGRIAFEKNDFKASNRYFEEAIKLDPDNLFTHGLYGESLYWQKDYNRAQAVFQQALQVAPNDRRFQIMLGLTLAQQKQYQAGQRYLKQALGEQGAYEEMARIYNNHSEYEKATLAMSKARESYHKQQQLATNFPSGGASTPTRVEQQRTAFPTAMPTQPYSPAQTTYPSQQQSTAMQQVTRQQPNAVPEQMPMQPYQPQFAAQQQAQPFPQQQPAFPQQQSVMVPNISYSNQPVENRGVNYGAMNPVVQQGQSPGAPYPGTMPQQVQQPHQPLQQDNRPPQGFAAAQQQPVATAPTTGMQTIPASFQKNGQEITYHPTNHSGTQPGIMQPGVMYPETPSPEMPLPINPLAERAASTGQFVATTAHANSAIPIAGQVNGNRDYQTQSPVFSGYPSF